MKARKQKRHILARIKYNNSWFFGLYGRGAIRRREALCADFAAAAQFMSEATVQANKEGLEQSIAARMAEDELQAVEEAKQEFVCTRVKDGLVVATFDTVAEARALVEKHIRQKKAKLEVLDTSTGEYVLFEEEAV
jgi:RecA/RadA recombinase